MTRANYRFSCGYCHLPEAICDRDYDDPVCTECNSSLDKILLCPCGNDAFDGISDCIPCLSEAVIKDPALLAECTRAAQVAVGVELANRLKPYLRTRQAA
jgi:hypothetical protein